MKPLFLVCSVLLVQLHASVSVGKEVYLTECAHCHVEGKYFASNKKAKTWSKLLKTDNLYRLHHDQNISLPYLNSDKYKADKKHLKALLQKYSKDRGKHNSCY